MATTTNYGWTTPDDTALVKDGASAIRTLGSSVDTTTKNLNPSTTLGDIEYRSSTANTNTRLGIGSTGNVLTVVGGVPSWAAPAGGSLTQLATGTLSGATTRVQSLSASYKGLKVIVRGFQPTTDGYNLEIRFNNDSNARYGNAPAFITRSDSTFSGTEISAPAFSAEASATNSLVIMDIWDYANTTTYKQVQYYGINESSTTAGRFNSAAGSGFYNQIGAINEITFFADGDTFAGGTYFVYGVN